MNNLSGYSDITQDCSVKTDIAQYYSFIRDQHWYIILSFRYAQDPPTNIMCCCQPSQGPLMHIFNNIYFNTFKGDHQENSFDDIFKLGRVIGGSSFLQTSQFFV